MASDVRNLASDVRNIARDVRHMVSDARNVAGDAGIRYVNIMSECGRVLDISYRGLEHLIHLTGKKVLL